MGYESFNEEAIGHIDALFGYAMALTRSRTDAEDLVQDTYVRAARAAPQLGAHSNLKSWLLVVMRNAWLNQMRHQNAGPHFVCLEEEDRASATWASELETNPQVIYLKKIERDQVRQAIESLPDAYREIVVLRDIEGCSYQEIASVLACPAGTVMSRLARARQKLRELLGTRQPKTRAKAV